ncbi:MAG TPA: hypothetical protein PKC39_07700 [Ferruginibacter sp.]|nr:hypothetical protein [Ferruginibacter sp.]HMP20828.1 hypothetical protein [Ferruginibacter sp.]
MKKLQFFTFTFISFLLLDLNSSFSCASDTNVNIMLVGCTPGDDLIKLQLSIPKETTIDFIKWDLTFNTLNPNTFILNIAYGESQPNTLGFKEGGQRRSYQGEYHISKSSNNEIYKLRSNGFQTDIEMIKLNENVFHLLTPQKQLMIGNGGWSYSLNNKTPDKKKYPLPILINSASILKDTALQVIYDGRTPCQEFAEENNLTVSQSCFKLKWKLILRKDPKTLQPTTYTLKRTNSRETDITGNWTILKGTATNPEAIVLQLDPDQPSKSISLFVGDGNVLFFLHKNETLFTGNDNFSFTLNKRQSK